MMYLNKFAQYFGLKTNLLRGLKEKDKTKTSFNTNEPFENMKKKTENNSPLLELRQIYLFQEGIMC